VTDTPKTITPDDLQAKFVELQDNVENATAGARDTAKKASVVGVLLLLILVYVLGRRRGSSGKTVVEVRRV
jgi:hypothetical protein